MNRKQFLKLSCGAVASSALANALPGANSKAQTGSQVSFDLRILGRTGIKVRPLGLGGARTNEPSLLRRALEAGLDFIDTGRGYFNGQNEVMIGQVIKGRRSEVVVQSKCRVNLGAPAAAMEKSLAESLKALQTDYIDVLLIHGADSVETIRHPAVMEFFAAAKKRGQIRASGFSVHVNQLELLKAAGSDAFYDVIMLPYNHRGKFEHSNSGRKGEWDQSVLEAELRAAMAKGLGVVAMKTCSGGPYAWPGEPKPSFGSAVRWILSRDCIHTSAVAMASFEQLEEDVKAIS